MFPRRAAPALFLVGALLVPCRSHAGNPFLIDHLVTYDDSGIWNRDTQKKFALTAAVVTIGGALFVDNDSRMGRTFDQALDSMVLTAGTTTVMKAVFSRERPSQNTDPGDFFDGSGYGSFPSGEAAEISSIVTPFIAEYHEDHPAVWALTLLPAYDMIARVKVHGHWQSDVIVGAGIGIAWGIWAHKREHPLIMGLLPHGGVMVAYQKKF
ncbi:phosphatase PAP2 family protein [Lysobacter sp. 2RAF19]